MFWEGHKSKVEILQSFVAFSEYMNFNQTETTQPIIYVVVVCRSDDKD